MHVRRTLCAAAMALQLSASPLLAEAATVTGQAVAIHEYPLPDGCEPNSIAAGPDAAVWFSCGPFGKIGRITTPGVITEYSVGGDPSAITAGPDGAIWFADSGATIIGRITSAGEVTRFPYSSGPEDWPLALTAGPDGALWFTEWAGHKVGRMSTNGGVTEYPIYPQPELRGQWFITSGPDGALWFSLPDPAGKFGRVTTTGFVKTIGFPVGTRPFMDWPIGVTVGPDRALWFNDSGRIGRISATGATTVFAVCPDPWRIPDAPSCPRPDITTGPDGALWFGTFSQTAGRITTAGVLSHLPLPFFPEQITVGPGGDLWFTGYRCDQFCNRYLIAQVVLGPPDISQPTSQVAPLARTEVLANFPVQWSGTDTGSGVRDYTIFVSDNGKPFTVWLWQTSAVRGVFPGSAGHTYGFYSIARDWAGNQESTKETAETTVQVAAMAIGDLNRDGRVDCLDLAIAKAAFGTRIGQTGFDPRADLNADGVVDVRDLALLSQKLVPETPCH